MESRDIREGKNVKVVISQGKTGNLRAVEHREIRGRTEKERETLPCGIKLISLLSLHQNLAFELARRSSISGKRWQQAAPRPAGADLLPKRMGWGAHAGTDTTRSTLRGTALGVDQKNSSFNPRKCTHLPSKAP